MPLKIIDQRKELYRQVSASTVCQAKVPGDSSELSSPLPFRLLVDGPWQEVPSQDIIYEESLEN